MPNVQTGDPLTGWRGDTASLIAEMKRRAGVTTDQNLARFLGVAQSTVAHWRQRDQIPEAALLRAERFFQSGGEKVANRVLAARMIVLRLAEVWYLQALTGGAKGGRGVFYRAVAATFTPLCDAVYEQLATYERHTGQSVSELGSQLLEDTAFIENFVQTAKSLPKIPADFDMAE